VIERAKGIVTKRLRVEEDEAFRRLRKRSSDSNQKLVDVARLVVQAEEIFHTLEHNLPRASA